MSNLKKFVPITDWLPKYSRSQLSGDITAGLTVAVMIIPQAIAYGNIAKVPPQVALYASIVPMAIYVFFGTCRELSVGPAAIISVMTATALTELVKLPEFCSAVTTGGTCAESGPEWIAGAIFIMVTVGAVQLGLGLARMGVVVQFLSRPVVSGFMSGAALIIASTQLKDLTGAPIAGTYFFERIISAVTEMPNVNAATIGLGVLCMTAITVAKKVRKSFPMPFLLVILTTALSFGLGFNVNWDVAIVGPVPGGFPVPKIPSMSFAQLQAVIPYAIPIALIGFLESISVSKTYAFQNGYEIDANQELRALGAANAVGGLFGGYVVTGNISRTVVSAQAGAKSQLAELLTASIVLLTVVVLAPLFEFLPKTMLAAMIIVAIIGVVDLGEARRLAKFKRRDAIALVVTFLATIILDVEIGILTGIATSIGLHLYHTTTPHTSLLGRISGTPHWLDAERHPKAVLDEEVIVIRIDESLYFANAPSLRDGIERAYTRHNVHAKGIVLDCIAINDLDSTAINVFEQVADEMKEAKTRLCLAGLSGPVHDILEKSGCMKHIGEENLFTTVHDAVLSFGVGEPTVDITHTTVS